jgi:DNA processing protein
LTKLNFEELTDLKLLLSVEGIGPGRIRNLLAKFRTLENILSASYSNLIDVVGIHENIANRIQRINSKRETTIEELNRELEKLSKLGGYILTVWDKEFPAILKKIYDPPLLLYFLGNHTADDDYCIAIVGTRQPTSYGKTIAERISDELSRQNITIVSGLARGIDSVAHRAALRSGGKTIAVIGSGLDVIYPPENAKLLNEISREGLVISEYPVGTKPDAVNFPKRNRIISGLSLGAVIVETSVVGGAMQTARYALDQNREVFAVPGNLGVRQSEGTNLLIQKGEAKLIRSSEDILIELELKLKPVIGKNIPKPKVETNLFEEKILTELSKEQLHIDEIALRTNMSTSDCLVHLLSLEFKGIIKQLPGKVFAAI